ncbi:hypothetical protein KUV41_13030 [Halomonas sp. DP8Y7-1]|uniref:hypothetical protein n=1 Tax=Halomonas sp. DP8Y7-1 TaxID=2859078 RepID=UPI001C956D4F|nr:hypothetical protein [Halomonas sp. DP8Y7-1]MBY6030279.1 hypothetical protein [Halomonas sp. DP8Y7-1]
MTPEPTRLAYLDAMGLTAWVARYQFPNARETEVCDWPELEPQQPPETGARGLHALLDEVPAARSHEAAQDSSVAVAAASTAQAPSPEPSQPAAPVARKARALLGDMVPDDEATSAIPALDSEEEGVEDAEPLRFVCQVACLDGRWLLLVAQQAPLGVEHQRLLFNILHCSGVTAEQRPVFETLTWPLAEGLPVRRPLEEARQGLKAFVAGRARRGWAPERVLVFGHEDALMQVLGEAGQAAGAEPTAAGEPGHSSTLALPQWSGPGLDELLTSATAKRRLWVSSADWQALWQQGREA